MFGAFMKPVTCAVDPNPPSNPHPTRRQPRWNSAEGPDFFPRHVLVVDDEPLIRWSVSETLSDLGYDVEQASDAASALRIVTTTFRPFEIVVLDLRLPDMNDLSLLGTIHQLLPRAMIILITAFRTPEIVAEATAWGAKIIEKPFELGELSRLIAAPDH